MRVVISSDGADLESRCNETFGRCPIFLFVETDTMAFEAVPNPAFDAAGGAGIRAAELIIGAGVQAVITGRVGPNAMNVLREAGVPVYTAGDGSVRKAVEDFKAGRLSLDPESPRGNESARPTRTGSRLNDLTALRGEVAALRQKLGRVLETVERLQQR